MKLRQKGDELKQEAEKVITFKKEIADKFEEEVKILKGIVKNLLNLLKDIRRNLIK